MFRERQLRFSRLTSLVRIMLSKGSLGGKQQAVKQRETNTSGNYKENNKPTKVIYSNYQEKE
jgi:hypothetical protein